MELRKIQEKMEVERLSVYAAKSCFSKGREREEEKCDIRTDFQRDRDRIIHCKAFRRMKHKTQVFISPEGDHYRTRLTHTLEVSQIARTISRALNLNEDLTEAIALGHDLGHTPFGHSGEAVLNNLSSTGFEHCEQSLRIVEKIEKNGEGLNLTEEVRDGILNHRSKGNPLTIEGKVVQLSDKIAYINHDIDDAIRAGVLKKEQLPRETIEVIGTSNSQRINAMIRDVIIESADKNIIIMSPTMAEAMQNLRKFMFANVYADERAKREGVKVERMLKELFEYYMRNEDKMEAEFLLLKARGDSIDKVVCDYIACMTDRYAIAMYTKLFIPSSWNIY